MGTPGTEILEGYIMCTSYETHAVASRVKYEHTYADLI